ncbi:MAG: DUF3644 domain-containing protein [Chloroflexales bacterium]|nr:DUF3644 domain-containing protein [Chloroflexales bacterium]
MSKVGGYSDEKFRSLLQVLKRLEREKAEVTAQDLAQASGYKLSSMKTYIAKKLKGFVLMSTQKGRFIIKDALSLDEASFVRHMSQRSPELDAPAQGLAPRLLRRSLDAYFLAIELYNRPIQSNRVEGFCIMMINAWELLLKAEIASSQDESALFYKEEPAKTIAIRDALKRLITNERDPVRRNIEYLTELRDKAIHLLIPELQEQVSRLFQASVFNYLKRYNSITGENLPSKLGTGLISLVIDPGQFAPDTLKEVYDPKTAEEVSDFIERFHREETELSSAEFAIPIEYKLTLSKNSQPGDITLTSGSSNAMGILIEVPRDIDKTHPYRQVDAVEKIKQNLQGIETISFTQYDFQAILFKEKVRKTKSSPYYHFIEKPETHRYSEAFIDFVLDKIKEDSEYVMRCRKSYKHHLDKNRKQK